MLSDDAFLDMSLQMRICEVQLHKQPSVNTCTKQKGTHGGKQLQIIEISALG